MSVRGYQLAFNWTGGGDYTGPSEDVTSLVTKATNLVATWGRADPRATSDGAASKMTGELNNNTRLLSPENASSPLYGKVQSGVPGRLRVGDPATGLTTDLFKGPIDSFTADPGGTGKFSFTCLDGWSKPGNTQLSTTVYQGMRTGDLIGVILDAVGWPAGARDIDAGATLVPYWWAEGTDAQTAVTDLVHSEGPPAMAYVQNGVFCFRDRHHRSIDARSLTSQMTCSHIVPAGALSAGGAKILKDSFTYDHGLDYVVNSARLTVTPRYPQQLQVVWSTDDPISLGPNQSATLVIQTNDPVLNLQQPTSAVTYVDTGDVLTSDYRIGQGSATFALSRDSGQSAFLTITAGASGVSLIDGVRVRGNPLTQGATRIFSASDPSSITTYGRSDWDGTAPWAHFYDADAIVNRIVSIYSRPMPSVTFQIDAVQSAATKTSILTSAISDRITVRNDQLGLNTDFMIEQLTHSVQQLGVRHVLTVGAQVAEPVQAANPFTFDVAGQGFNQGQFALDTGNNPATMFLFDVAGHGFNQGVFAA